MTHDTSLLGAFSAVFRALKIIETNIIKKVHIFIKNVD